MIEEELLAADVFFGGSTEPWLTATGWDFRLKSQPGNEAQVKKTSDAGKVINR